MNYPEHVKHPKLLKIASYASFLTAAMILVAKLFAWVSTDSIAILASLVDSLLDITASLLNVFAIRYSLKPPNDKFRFGHDKIQDLAVFAQSMFFLASGLFLICTSIYRFLEPQEVTNSNVGIYVMIFSLTLTTILVIFQNYVIRRTESKIIEADKLHYFTDLMNNAIIIIVIYLSQKHNMAYLDPIAGIALAIYLMWNAYKLLKYSLKNLLDQEFSDEEKQRILEIIGHHKAIFGIHELKTRCAGNKPFIQFHLEMDGDLSLSQAHKICHEIEDKIAEAFPGCEIIIHQDPKGEEKNVNYRVAL